VRWRTKGWSSLARDSWEVLDANDVLLGTILEDSALLSLIRRFLANIIPQTFHADVGGRRAATWKQRFNPFVLKLDVTVDPSTGLDPRLALAAGILLAAIEGRQE